jgi:hypothetical protein
VAFAADIAQISVEFGVEMNLSAAHAEPAAVGADGEEVVAVGLHDAGIAEVEWIVGIVVFWHLWGARGLEGKRDHATTRLKKDLSSMSSSFDLSYKKALKAASLKDRRGGRSILVRRSDIEDLMDGFGHWCEQNAKSEGLDSEVGVGADGFITSIFLGTPDDKSRRMVVVAILPADGFGGGFGRMQGMPLAKVFFDGKLHWRSLCTLAMRRQIESLAIHELTHAVDRIADKATVQTEISDRPPKLGELAISAKSYFNDPTEVRAYLAQLFDEISDQVKERMKGPLRQKWGLAKIIMVALGGKSQWKVMQLHLTEEHRKWILRGLVRAFESET